MAGTKQEGDREGEVVFAVLRIIKGTMFYIPFLGGRKDKKGERKERKIER